MPTGGYLPPASLTGRVWDIREGEPLYHRGGSRPRGNVIVGHATPMPLSHRHTSQITTQSKSNGSLQYAQSVTPLLLLDLTHRSLDVSGHLLVADDEVPTAPDGSEYLRGSGHGRPVQRMGQSDYHIRDRDA